MNEEQVTSKVRLTGDANVISIEHTRNVIVPISHSVSSPKNTGRNGTPVGAGESYTGKGNAKKLYEDSTNNCVLWAKEKTGINRVLGAGGRSAIQGTEPRIGAIGAEKGKQPHAVVITAIDGDVITVNESNYIKGWVTERRLTRDSFMGFIYN